MPPDAEYFYRVLQRQEAKKAHLFIIEHSDGFGNCSLQSCYHHASSIFVCSKQDGEWIGLIFSYLSPGFRGKAVVDAIVVAREWRQKGIATYMAGQLFDFWKKSCVFRICFIPPELPAAGKSLLDKLGFQSCEKDGFTIYNKQLLPDKICMHNRVMRPKMNTINGEVSEDTVFEYFQKDDTVWGTYSGGSVVRGVLLGRMSRNGDIVFDYRQLGTNGEINSGISKSSTEFLNDGRIILYEDWEWTGNRTGGGRSVIEEIKEE